MVANTFVGGGTRRPLDQPSQTMISHASAKPTGSSNPSAGRANRRKPPGRRGRRDRFGLLQQGRIDGHGHSKTASGGGMQVGEYGEVLRQSSREGGTHNHRASLRGALSRKCADTFRITKTEGMGPGLRGTTAECVVGASAKFPNSDFKQPRPRILAAQCARGLPVPREPREADGAVGGARAPMGTLEAGLT